MTIYNVVLPVYRKHLPQPHSLFICRPTKNKKIKQAGNQSFHFPDKTQFCILFLKGKVIIHRKTGEYTKYLFNLKIKQGTKTTKNKYF